MINNGYECAVAICIILAIYGIICTYIKNYYIYKTIDKIEKLNDNQIDLIRLGLNLNVKKSNSKKSTKNNK